MSDLRPNPFDDVGELEKREFVRLIHPKILTDEMFKRWKRRRNKAFRGQIIESLFILHGANMLWARRRNSFIAMRELSPEERRILILIYKKVCESLEDVDVAGKFGEQMSYVLQEIKVKNDLGYFFGHPVTRAHATSMSRILKALDDKDFLFTDFDGGKIHIYLTARGYVICHDTFAKM